MLVIPAHTIEAKEMANALYEEFVNLGFDELIGSRSISFIREAMSFSFGFNSWKEMISYVSSAHEATYLDDNFELQTEICTRLYDYPNLELPRGFLAKLIDNSGAGFSPKQRRINQSIATPWGIIQFENTVAVGINRVETASHGGYILSQTRQQQMPAHLSNGTIFYEEDTEVSLVHIAFPDEFKDEQADNLNRLQIVSYFTTDELNTNELEVIRYLNHCALVNREPIASPTSKYPCLSDWVDALVRKPKLNNKWTTKKNIWKNHVFDFRSEIIGKI